MPKYVVTLTETVQFRVEVEADSEEEAEVVAEETWCQEEDPNSHFPTFGLGVEATNVEKL